MKAGLHLDAVASPKPFEKRADDSFLELWTGRIHFKDRLYAVDRTHTTPFRIHYKLVPKRQAPNLDAIDFALMGKIAEMIHSGDRNNGVGSETKPLAAVCDFFNPKSDSTPWVIHGFALDAVSQLDPAPWHIFRAADSFSLERTALNGYYAIRVKASDLGSISTIHRALTGWGMAHSILALPVSYAGPGELLIVPMNGDFIPSRGMSGRDLLLKSRFPREKGVSEASGQDLDPALFLERKIRELFQEHYRCGAIIGVAEEESSEGRVLYAPKTKCFRPFGPNGRPHARSLPGLGTKTHSPERDPGILVQITRASICQSDRRVLCGRKHHELDREGGLVLGHEGGGYVVDPGPWHREPRPGQKAVLLPHHTCGVCPSCRSGETNRCKHLDHLGFHIHGVLADLAYFPRQCVYPLPGDFPEDAMPLVEPLACVLRGFSMVCAQLTRRADLGRERVIVFGAGPIGCLVKLLFSRRLPRVSVTLVDPDEGRRQTVADQGIAAVLQELPPEERYTFAWVATSEYQGYLDAIRSLEGQGALLAFSGINLDQWCPEDNRGGINFVRTLETVHRNEEIRRLRDPESGKRFQGIGSSGYTLEDVSESVLELKGSYQHYQKVQNRVIDGLTAKGAGSGPNGTAVNTIPIVEALMAPRGLNDPVHGRLIAGLLKALIRI